EVENRRRTDVVLLLDEVQVFRRGFEPAAGERLALDRLLVGEQRFAHLAFEVADEGVPGVSGADEAAPRRGDAGVGREAVEQVHVDRDLAAPRALVLLAGVRGRVAGRLAEELR